MVAGRTLLPSCTMQGLVALAEALSTSPHVQVSATKFLVFFWGRKPKRRVCACCGWIPVCGYSCHRRSGSSSRANASTCLCSALPCLALLARP